MWLSHFSRGRLTSKTYDLLSFRVDTDKTRATSAVKSKPAKRFKILDGGTHFSKNVHENSKVVEFLEELRNARFVYERRTFR